MLQLLPFALLDIYKIWTDPVRPGISGRNY